MILLVLMCAMSKVYAQGDGPRVITPAPIGIQPLSLTWMDIGSNQNFAGDILLPTGSLDANIWALNYNRFFSLKGRLAELWVTGIGGDLDGSLGLPDGRSQTVHQSGLSDPYVALRVGLVGAPALTPQAFAGHQHGFSLYALAGLTLPWGEYEQRNPLNLGTNRWSLRLGSPMTQALGSAGRTWLELNPSVTLFGDNDEPFRADRRSQDPLLAVETHLSHNFTARFWGSLDLRFRYGGETTTDGLADGNRMNQWGGGASLGYQFNRALSAFMGYGEIFSERDGSAAEMWRARVIFVF